MEEKLKARLEKVQKDEEEYDPSRFYTRTYKKVVLLELKNKEDKGAKVEMQKLLQEKKDNYAKYVREMHLPAISEEK
jgi:hypothetical protein